MFNKCLFALTLLFAGSVQINGDSITKASVRTDIKGRLLTPEEGCGQSNVALSSRIVGGTPAPKGAWPWIALIGRENYTHVSFACGGSLITSRHVLSASHCFKRPCNFVRLGEYNTLTTEDGKHIDVPIKHVEMHENYKWISQINDIAIVYLKFNVEFTDRIKPVCLPTSEYTQHLSYVGKMPYVAGWGRIGEDAQMTNTLQQVQVPVITNDLCKQQYQEAKRLQAGAQFRFNETYVMCAGAAAGGVSPCKGDSGGPLMLSILENGRSPFYQIGVVSYGYGCARPNMPAVFTNVRNYVDWIIEKLKLQ